MNTMQQRAWVYLGVTVLSVATVIALIPVLGPGALGGFGLLGFTGVWETFARRRQRRLGAVVADERDLQIQQNSVRIAQSVMWLILVAATVAAGYVWESAVPLVAIHAVVWSALAVMMLVLAISTLIQYRRDEDLGSGESASAH